MALQTEDTSQTIFPLVLTAENNCYELQLGKTPLPHDNIHSQDNPEL